MAFGLVTEWVETIPAGAKKRLTGLAGDWFEIAELTEGKSVHVSVNEGPFVRRKEGSILQGEPGRDELQRLDFENRNATDVDIVVTVGKGKTSQNNDAVVKNASLPVSVEATATIAADDFTAQGTSVPNGTSTTRTNIRTITVRNTGNVDLTVAGITISPGFAHTWPPLGGKDRFTITIDCTGTDEAAEYSEIS